MSKPKKRVARQSSAYEPTRLAWSSRSLPHLCLSALVALVVATPLIPSEGVREGTHLTLILLELLLAVGWFLVSLVQRSEAFQLGWASLALAAFVGWQAISTYVMLDDGNGRYALNSMWQWTSLGVVFFLLRQLLTTHAAARGIVAVMIGLAVCLSAHGLYQYAVEFPAMRQDYRERPDDMIREAGIEAPAGSPARKQFEDRLNALEPTSTFALTNSLAGFLLPWLTIAVGLLVRSFFKSKPAESSSPPKKMIQVSSTSTWILAIVVVAITSCLLLTKSRAGYLAAAASMFCLVAFAFRRRMLNWRIPLVFFGVTALLVAIAIFAGGIDKQVLTEASKSLLYRVEYWQSAVAMIADHPLFGSGPGNFQSYYTQYKLPQASEVVSDPHNFLLEIWATTGTLGIVAFISVLVLFFGQLRRQSLSPQLSPSSNAPNSEQPHELTFIYAGAVAGIMLAYFAGLLGGHIPSLAILVCSLPMAAVVYVLHTWSKSGELPTFFCVVAIGGLLLNLLVAGGIAFPGVGQSLWILMAVGLCVRHDDSRTRSFSRPIAVIGLATSILVFVVFYWQTARPVSFTKLHLSDARLLEAQRKYVQAEYALTLAAEADPFSPEPKRRLASLMFQNAMGIPPRGQPYLLGRDIPMSELMLKMEALEASDPASASTRRQIGNWYLAIATATQDDDTLALAITKYREAIDRYPNSAILHAQLAWTYHLNDDETDARKSASHAVSLDQQNPHTEQQLANQTIFEGKPPASPSQNVPSAADRMQEIVAGD